jgi:hypothetical protein
MRLLMIFSLAASLLATTDRDYCRGKVSVETKPGVLIYGCTYKAVARVDVVDPCGKSAIYSRLRIIGKYDSWWTRGSRKASYKYMAFVAGTVDVAYEWICVECGTYGKVGKRFPIGG